MTDFRLPNCEIASAEQIKEDCDAWKTSFARDQRASFIQNHDHHCTGTCIKYQRKTNATELPQRAGQKIAGPSVPKCRFRFYGHVALRIAGAIRYVIRRGRELVQNAFIATGIEENEYGNAMVPRESPFRSSSMDVLQSTVRCNADYQYQKRAVPDPQGTEQKLSATELPQRAGQKIAGPSVPKCRFRFYHHVALRIAGAIRYVIRRGKELVQNAFIATGNEENEYGKAMVPRESPFRSSSMDVLQSTVCCNADYQYQKRAVPDLQGTEQKPSATEQRQSTESHKCTASFLYGCGALKRDMCLRIMRTLATAMRAANVADFYMTKYLSKAQEALGPVMQPFIAGMRRIAVAESAPEAADTSLVQRAQQRIRRFIFCANRTMWFSACELGVFLATGDSCVKTEYTCKVFSGKGIAMMHECKRLLNHSSAA